MLSRRATLALPGLIALPAGSRAQGWKPRQAIRLIVPAAPGGTADISARLLAPFLQSYFGQNCVVENRSGAGGTIGTLEVVRASPDGQTLLLGNIGPQAIGYSLFKNLQYQPSDLLPISGTVRGTNVLVLHPSIPANSVAEFVAYLKAHPGMLSYGSPGMGQSPHLTGVWFNQLTGTKAIHVPFRGAGPAAIELVAGNIDYMWDNLTSGIQQIRAGRVKTLAVSSAERNPQLPDIPAARETLSELTSFEVNTWFGVFAPAATPPVIAQSLNEAMRQWQATEEIKARWREMGGMSLYGTLEQYAAFVDSEIAKWRGVVRKEGLELDAN
jgi:tripartite-type tricarboxylate transporter receptor subunit TctC